MNWKPATALAVGASLVVAGLLILVFGGDRGDSDRAVVNPAWLAKPPSGPVRFCGGEDLSNRTQSRSEDDYNDRFSGSKATFVEASATADAQHDAYLKSLERGSDDCDVIALDVIYMAEFASKGLLYDMTPYLLANNRQADFEEEIIKTAKYEGKLWGVPKQFDVGVLYYRADRKRAPSSWHDVYRQARRRSPDDVPGLRFQLAEYEGLTVVFLELAYAAGAQRIISEDDKTANIDQTPVHKALRFMHDAIREKVIPRSRQPDKSTKAVYELGRASFLRGWPSVAAELDRDLVKGRTPAARRERRAAADNTRIVSLPPWNPGGQSVGVLGGHNLVIPRSARNPSAALRLIDYFTSDGQVRKDEHDASQLPVLKRVRDDPALRNRPVLKAVEATEIIPRPSIPAYAKISTIISSGINAVLFGSGDVAIPDKLQEIERDVQRVLDGSSP